MLEQAFASWARRRLMLVTGDTRASQSHALPDSNTEQHNVVIREARTREEKEQVYRFRYRVSAHSDNVLDHHADHTCKQISDELDSNGFNLLALFENQMVAAIRVNYAWRTALGLHADFYRMREVAGSDYPLHSCVISRLLVDPAARGGRLGYRLFQAAYRQALEQGARVAFLNCEDHLIYYFSVLGFKAYMGHTLHREFGQVVPMKLDLLDERYLMLISSPLLQVLRAWKQT